MKALLIVLTALAVAMVAAGFVALWGVSWYANQPGNDWAKGAGEVSLFVWGMMTMFACVGAVAAWGQICYKGEG